MNKKTTQTIGLISKEETFAPIYQLADNKCLILEPVQPFPGYHETTVPDNLDPDSYCLVTKSRYYDDKFLTFLQV